MTRHRRLGLLGLAFLNVFLTACPCHTVVKLRGMLGSAPNPSALTEGGGYLLVACPNEPISLGWGTSDDVKALRVDPTIGSVPKGTGFQVIPAPTANTTYTATGTGGDCDRTDSVQVIAVQNGSTV